MSAPGQHRLEQVLAGLTPPCVIERHAVLDSTNSHALAVAARVETVLPRLILATEQTAGRGRGAHLWWSDPGALCFTLAIDANEYGLPPSQWPLIALSLAAVWCDLLAAPGIDLAAQIKWPNDLYCAGRKLGGILVEPIACDDDRPSTRLAIGCGMNVNNRLDQAPRELRTRAISLLELLDRELSLDELLAELIPPFTAALSLLARDPMALAERWQRRCYLRGRNVTVQEGDRLVRGDCAGLQSDGGLLLTTEQGPHRCYSGHVVSIA